MKNDLSELNSVLKEYRKYISEKTFKSLHLSPSLKTSYGLPKIHKESIPFRPIISSRNSLTAGIEGYLFGILNKFKPKFKFRLENMQQFKSEFLEIRDKIDLSEHCIVSYDVVSMYTDLPIPEVVDLIFEEIYKIREVFFEKETLKNGQVSK